MSGESAGGNETNHPRKEFQQAPQPAHESENLRKITGKWFRYSSYFCDVVIIGSCVYAMRLLFKDLSQISERKMERESYARVRKRV